MTTNPTAPSPPVGEIEARHKLAAFISEWDRVSLESGMGDWLDTHELPGAERAMILAALTSRPAPAAEVAGWNNTTEDQFEAGAKQIQLEFGVTITGARRALLKAIKAIKITATPPAEPSARLDPKTVEACAKVAEQYGNGHSMIGMIGGISAAIRALIPEATK